jgi:hypothetical protein
MAGLVPAIHDLRGFNRLKSWMTGTRPVMTDKQWFHRLAWNSLLHRDGCKQFPHGLFG